METRERTKVTKGIFRGYATIGTDDAIVVELDESHQELKGKLRLIPLHVVLAVDILEQVPGDAPKVEKHGTMYGCLGHPGQGSCRGRRLAEVWVLPVSRARACYPLA